jgi:hypothetical protein
VPSLCPAGPTGDTATVTSPEACAIAENWATATGTKIAYARGFKTATATTTSSTEATATATTAKASTATATAPISANSCSSAVVLATAVSTAGGSATSTATEAETSTATATSTGTSSAAVEATETATATSTATHDSTATATKAVTSKATATSSGASKATAVATETATAEATATVSTAATAEAEATAHATDLVSTVATATATGTKWALATATATVHVLQDEEACATASATATASSTGVTDQKTDTQCIPSRAKQDPDDVSVIKLVATSTVTASAGTGISVIDDVLVADFNSKPQQVIEEEMKNYIAGKGTEKDTENIRVRNLQLERGITLEVNCLPISCDIVSAACYACKIILTVTADGGTEIDLHATANTIVTNIDNGVSTEEFNLVVVMKEDETAAAAQLQAAAKTYYPPTPPPTLPPILPPTPPPSKLEACVDSCAVETASRCTKNWQRTDELCSNEQYFIACCSAGSKCLRFIEPNACVDYCVDHKTVEYDLKNGSKKRTNHRLFLLTKKKHCLFIIYCLITYYYIQPK